MQWDNQREELDDLHLEGNFPVSLAEDTLASIFSADDSECLPSRDAETPRSSNERNLFAWAVGSSLLLHAGMLLALFSFRMNDRVVATLETDNNPLQESIAVRFVVENPLREAQPGDENGELQSAEQISEEDEQLLRVAPAEESVAELDVPLDTDPSFETPNEEAVVEATVEATVEANIEETVATPPTLTETIVENSEAAPSRLVPSVSAMRSSIQRINEQQRSRDWMQQCNPLEEDAELLECGESEQPDYSAATRNTTYLALNPTFTATREQRSISTITLQRGTLLAQLEEADVPQWLKDYARQEMDISISDESRFVNSTVDQIQQMTEKGDAAARARMMFGDAWLLETVRKEVQKNVHRKDRLTGSQFSGSQ